MIEIEYPRSLQRRFETDIVEQVLAVGQVVSAESIGERYDASLADVTRIIGASLRKGLLAKADDRRFRVLGKPPAAVESVFQHGMKNNLNPTSNVRALEVHPATNSDAAILGIEPGELVYRQLRTRLINGEVVANQCNTIPYDVCPGLGKIDLSQRSFQVTLHDDFHAVIARIEERFVLDAASAEDATVLGIRQNSMVLDARRLSYSRTDRVLVSAELHIRTDRYHYVSALWPQAAALLALPS